MSGALTGRLLFRAFDETFEGGGWLDAPRWEDYDEDGHARWDRAARRLSELLTSPAKSVTPWGELLALPEVQARLAAGQKFNAYEAGRGWAVTLGPITDYYAIGSTMSPHHADMIVAALRIATGQAPVLVPAVGASDEGAKS